MEKWNPRRQGDIGELSAISWLIRAGAVVSQPLFHSPDYDLIADFGDRPLRVQVKTSVAWHNERFVVALCTRGGNQSWNGVIKRLDATRCDHLFVHVGDGRRWFIPATALGGGSGISLGGPKYSEYEVEAGEPLSPRFPTLDSGAPWRGS
ncbi:MAG TPA: group I intron-associated PD-(D/E)XK endonuclease, partial [Solirubrobacteraceae bacterium]|nr:group I intron-associated PD-(D/E)XK endonuclease [Solirubrobacteraceae bacterium]